MTFQNRKPEHRGQNTNSISLTHRNSVHVLQLENSLYEMHADAFKLLLTCMYSITSFFFFFNVLDCSPKPLQISYL